MVISMEIAPSDIVDRYTIVKLKIERTHKKFFLTEYRQLERRIDLLKKNDLITKSQINELYKVNSKIWDLEENIGNIAANNPDYKKIGKLALQVRKLNNRRTQIKSKIVGNIKKGFRDEKIYYTS